MLFFIIRISFIILMVVLCRAIGLQFDNPSLGMLIGFSIAVFFVVVEIFMKNVSLRGMTSAIFGAIFGLLMAKIVHDVMVSLNVSSDVVDLATPLITFIFIYIGLTFSLKKKDEFAFVLPYIKFSKIERDETPIILDTSSIIDGRIFDIVRTGFLKGKLIVPGFVIKELQKLSDSQDHAKRQKGRSALELLSDFRSDKSFSLDIYDEDFSLEKEVDAKLVHLAKLLEASIVTTDYNLTKVASLEGVDVLNINELVMALQPKVYSGQNLNIKLVKEGKDPSQAVGYTQEGTMVVVENAKNLIGKSVSVEVYNTIQTNSGKIIFARLKARNSKQQNRGNSY